MPLFAHTIAKINLFSAEKKPQGLSTINFDGNLSTYLAEIISSLRIEGKKSYSLYKGLGSTFSFKNYLVTAGNLVGSVIIGKAGEFPQNFEKLLQILGQGDQLNPIELKKTARQLYLTANDGVREILVKHADFFNNPQDFLEHTQKAVPGITSI